MKKKIKKVTPIKSETLCKKCEYDYDAHCSFHKCENCERHKDSGSGVFMCSCNLIKNGEKCEDFKLKVPSLQIGGVKITNSKIDFNSDQPSVSKAVEYIEIEKVIEILKNNTPILIPTGSGMRNVERLLKNAVATDVEKVVRCKNCEHSNDCKITVAKSITMDAKGKVTFHRDNEHYCSKGKRKEV